MPIAVASGPLPPVPLAFDRRLEPITPQELLFSLRGRIPRGLYWRWGVLAPTGLGALLYLLLGIAGLPEGVADVLISALLLWPSLAVTVKRWHDRDRSGWWALIVMVPVIGPLWTLYECGLRRGTPGPNRHGDPLADPAPMRR